MLQWCCSHAGVVNCKDMSSTSSGVSQCLHCALQHYQQQHQPCDQCYRCCLGSLALHTTALRAIHDSTYC